MKTITDKDIIVVAPEQYRDIARKLSHVMGKKTGLNGSFWTIKQYETNEFELGAARFVILLGNPDENALTKDYLPIIGDKLKNRAGACFGCDGSKAVIFGDAKFRYVEEFKTLFEHLMSNAELILFPLHNVKKLLYLIDKKLSEKAKLLKLLRSQTEVAATLFLTEDFDKMANINKTE